MPFFITNLKDRMQEKRLLSTYCLVTNVISHTLKIALFPNFTHGKKKAIVIYISLKLMKV